MENTAFSLKSEDAGAKEFLKRYEIGQLLGMGAFSEVRKATDMLTKQEVAIKIIDKQQSREDNISVETEIAILKKVRHPNIIALFDVYEGIDKIFLVTELVTGGELFDRIVDKGHYTEQDAARIVRKILEAVHYLHELGIAHRDLKPENLLLSDNSDTARVMISDFGLSKMMKEEELMKTACGTPGYVAPEVLNYVGYGKEVDLWSTGVIAYVLLCGYAPFFGEKDADLFAAIMNGAYEFDSPYWDDISPGAKDLISKLLVVDSTKRLTSQQALNHPWIRSSIERIPSVANLAPSFKNHMFRHPSSRRPVDVKSAIGDAIDLRRRATLDRVAHSDESTSSSNGSSVASTNGTVSLFSSSSSTTSESSTGTIVPELVTSTTSLSSSTSSTSSALSFLSTTSSTTSATSSSPSKSKKKKDAPPADGDDVKPASASSSPSSNGKEKRKTTSRKNSAKRMEDLVKNETLVIPAVSQAKMANSSSMQSVSSASSRSSSIIVDVVDHFGMPTLEQGKIVRVLSYNIFLRPPLIKNNLSDFKDARINYFIEHELKNYDIIGLQEIFDYGSNRQERLIEAAYKQGFAYHVKSPRRSLLQGKIDGGLLLLSRFPIVSSASYKFARGVYSDRLIAKGAIYARVELSPARFINVFVTLLQTTVLREDGAEEELCRLSRQQQIRFFKEFMMHQTAGYRQDEPILVLADMEVDGRISSSSGLDSDEYVTMMEILHGADGNSALIHVDDIIKDVYGEHPVTFGDTNALGKPTEEILTNKTLQSARARFDYIFWIPAAVHNPKKPPIVIDRKETRVEPFFVASEKFSQLSDHYGIMTSLFVPNLTQRSSSILSENGDQLGSSRTRSRESVLSH